MRIPECLPTMMEPSSLNLEPDSLRLNLQVQGEGRPWLFHLKPRALSLAIGPSEIITFDREGRLHAAFLDGRNYRRGLDGRVLEKQGEEGPEGRRRQRRVLSAEERTGFLSRVIDRLGQLAQAAPATEGLDPGDLAVLARWTGRLRRWDAAVLEADAARFHQVYRTVSILPPDQYMALVVQTTEGCPWNRCTFCDLYRDRPYRVKSETELDDHLAAILDLLGEGIRLRRSVFLGDANMLAVPLPALLKALALIRRRLAEIRGPEPRFHGFTDVFGVRRHPVDDLAVLREEGVRRLYLGLETGSPYLLELLGKPGSVDEAVRAVRQIRAAGITVGVIVLLGLGGIARATEHEEGTAAALNAMELGSGDIVYFSPLIEHAHGEYRRQAAELGFGSFSPGEMQRQRRRLERRLAFGSSRPLLSLYDIRDFIY